MIPQATTCVSPTELLHGRQIHTRLRAVGNEFPQEPTEGKTAKKEAMATAPKEELGESLGGQKSKSSNWFVGESKNYNIQR